MKTSDSRASRRFYTSFLVVVISFGFVHAIGEEIDPADQVTVLNYDLAVEIGPDVHSFNAIATLEVVTARDVQRAPFAFNKDLTIKRVLVDGKDVDFQRKENELTIEFGRVDGNSLSIVVEYSGTTQEKAGGFQWGYIGDTTYMIYESLWYPSIHGQRAPARVQISAPANYASISSGELIEVKEIGNRKVYVWQSIAPAYGISFASGKYRIKAMDLATNKKSNGLSGSTPVIQVSCYLFEKDFYQADGCLRMSKNVLEFYTSKFGGYPYTSFAVVEMPEEFFGGHGDQGFILLQANVLRAGSEEFVAHEIAHNWWGAMISAEGGYNLLPFAGMVIETPRESSKNHWLNEGFATYSAMLFLEKRYGRETMTRAIKEKRAEYLQADYDVPIAQVNEDYGSSDYHAIVYSKGALVLHMLRYVAGDEAFEKIVDTYIQRFKGRSATIEEFKKVSEEVYGGSLDWFFDSWLGTTSLPDYTVGSVIVERCGEKYCVRVEVLQEGDQVKMPVDVALHTGKNVETKRAWLEGDKTYVEFESMYEPQAVELDPDYWLLEGERANNVKVLSHLSFSGLKALLKSFLYRLD